MSHPNLIRVFVTRHPCREVNLCRASPILPSDSCRLPATVVLTTTKLSAEALNPLMMKKNFLRDYFTQVGTLLILENEKLTQAAAKEDF
jgi:hypothetical protein